MRVSLSSSVPTHYQLQSIRAFGLPVKKHGNGVFSCYQEFRTKKEAILHMKRIAYNLDLDYQVFMSSIRDIVKHGRLEYDSAILSLNKVSLSDTIKNQTK